MTKKEHDQRRRLLVVEDSEDDFVLLERRLEWDGFAADCTRVQSMDAVAEQLAGHRWDAVVCDVDLPAMGPADVIDEMRRHRTDVPIIVVSGVVSSEDLVAMMRAGANDVLHKSDYSRLVPVLEREIAEAGEREGRRLAEARLAIAVENMSHGLVMFSADDEIVVTNSRFAEIYGLASEDVAPGTAAAELKLSRPGDGDPQGRFDIAGAPPQGADCFDTDVFELPDGRVIARARRRLAEGGWVSTHEDITELQRIQERLRFLAEHDALTGLPNRVLLNKRIDSFLPYARRGRSFALFVVDLDRFKEINDAFGHPVGDALLQAVGERFAATVRESDTVARLGGDEFVILQAPDVSPGDVAALARRLVAALRDPIEIDGHQVAVDISIGIAIAPHDASKADDLVRCADMALYKSKAAGGPAWSFFERAMDHEMQLRRQLENDLRAALENDRFELHYQPLVVLDTGKLVGFEALLRWRDPERGLVMPDVFLSMAEEIGLMNALGEWVLTTACQHAATWPDHLRVAVNVSPVQFKAGGLEALVLKALTTSRLDPGRLELEVTESVLLNNMEATLATLRNLKELGIRIVMDDFGTGYSALSYLRQFPFDKVKLDRSFLTGLPDADRPDAIVAAVANLSHNLGAETTAEGIENDVHLELARTAGYVEGQGYLLGRPTAAEELAEKFLSDDGPDDMPAVASTGTGG